MGLEGALDPHPRQHVAAEAFDQREPLAGAGAGGYGGHADPDASLRQAQQDQLDQAQTLLHLADAHPILDRPSILVEHEPARLAGVAAVRAEVGARAGGGLGRHDADSELGGPGIVWAIERDGRDGVASESSLGSLVQPLACALLCHFVLCEKNIDAPPSLREH